MGWNGMEYYLSDFGLSFTAALTPFWPSDPGARHPCWTTVDPKPQSQPTKSVKHSSHTTHDINIKPPTGHSLSTASYVPEHIDIYVASRRACASASSALLATCLSQAPPQVKGLGHQTKESMP